MSWRCLFLLCASLCVSAKNQDFPELTLLTEVHPPLTYVENNEVKGFAVDLLVETLAELGSKQGRSNIQVLPWARAYSIALVKSNTLIFATTYAPHRHDLFHWAGIISPAKTVVLAKVASGLTITEASQLKALRLGTVREDIGEQLLVNFDIQTDELFSNTKPEYVIKMLARNRLDGFIYSDIVGFWYLTQLRLNPADYKPIFTLHEGYYYFALSKSTPNHYAKQFEQAYYKVQMSERFREVLDKYPSVKASLQQ